MDLISAKEKITSPNAFMDKFYRTKQISRRIRLQTRLNHKADQHAAFFIDHQQTIDQNIKIADDETPFNSMTVG